MRAALSRTALKIILACAMLSAALTDTDAASAHGVGYRRSDRRAVTLEFYYSTGEVMSYQEARVFSPGDAKNSYQSGRADEFGRVSFTPESAGAWKVVVNDPEGHRVEATVDIGEDFFTAAAGAGTTGLSVAPTSLPGGFDLLWRAALGVSVIFNMAALAGTFRARAKKAGA
jgi:nickel transport protein